jgi:DAK2 domain fusion protein YloV
MLRIIRPLSLPVLATTCDGLIVKRLMGAGLAWLEQHYETVNRLNVFPVPDGDTGTNMLLTMRAAYLEIVEDDSKAVGVIADKLAHGAIHGSRGNSGTVLSQFFKGFADAIRGKYSLDARQIAAGFRAAIRAGYQTFQNPVEGTILTVAREIAEEVETAAPTVPDLRLILKRAVARGKRAVARTPDLLPILKKAGVVDSGGQGLVVILEGMLRYLYGQSLAVSNDPISIPLAPIAATTLDEAFTLSEEHGEDGFGYDVQYVIEGENLDVDAIRGAIRAMGRSAIVIGDSTMVKVHVHVHNPDEPLAYGRRWGRLNDTVVEDMQAQSEQYRALRTGKAESRLAAVSAGDIAVITVAPGDGLRDVFRDLGAAAVISGGQTMNPSTGELLRAIQALKTDKIVLLPNNDNILLTARQAARMARPDRRVIVVPTRTIPQGIAAMLTYLATGDLETVAARMRDAAGQIVTGEVTTATRSLEIDGLRVEAGQFIGLIDGALKVAGDDLPGLVRELLARMEAGNHEVITLYYGDLVTGAEATALADSLQADYPDQKFECVRGGQPYYQYLLGIE